MVITSFATGRAKFYPIGCFQTGPWGGQWSQRAARKTGSGGRLRAPQKLRARGGYRYGTKETVLNIMIVLVVLTAMTLCRYLDPKILRGDSGSMPRIKVPGSQVK